MAGPSLPDAETLEGTLEHVVFANERNHWTVARLRVHGNDDRITIVGTLPGLRAGEVLRVSGRHAVHQRFGPQFQVDSFQSVTPTTVDGIRRYLASGILSGMGKVLAERIVETFGDETLRVVDESPERLLEVEGIGRKKLESIIASWRASRAARETLVFLRGHGFGAALANRVFEVYGDRAMAVAREHPYRLTRDVDGVGFVIADRLARSVGFSEDAPERLEAGLRHVLAERLGDGQVATPWSELVERAARLLDIDPIEVDAALADLESGNAVRSERDADAARLVYLPRLHAAEVEVAGALRRLAAGVPAAVGALGHVDTALRNASVDLTEDQLDAVRLAVTNKLAVITGGPGVGKTTIVRTIVDVSRRAGLRVELAAPTGRAAKRMTEATGRDARTIHRLLEFDPGSGRFARGPDNPIDAEFVLIDETSMVDLLLMRDLLAALPAEANLVLVGDADQLPSVGPGRVLGDMLDSGVIPARRLTRVFRQEAGGLIVENAHRINRGEMPTVPIDVDGADFFMIPREDPEAARAVIEEMVTRRIPDRFGIPSTDIQVLTPMYRGEVGADRLNERLQATLNPGDPHVTRGTLRLRIGDRVMQLANDYDRGVFNGDVGRVDDVTADAVHVVIDQRTVRYTAKELEQLTLAYAITVHKSQGSEYPAVIVPMSTAHWPLLQRNLLYTAMTRGRRIVVVVGSMRALERAVGNAHVARRHGLLARRLRADDAPSLFGPAFDPAPSGERGGTEGGGGDDER